MADRNLGLRLYRRWWEQLALDIIGIRAGHAAAEGGGDREGDGGIGGRGRWRVG